MRYIFNMDAISIVLKLDRNFDAIEGYSRDHFPAYPFARESAIGNQNSS